MNEQKKHPYGIIQLIAQAGIQLIPIESAGDEP